MTTSVREVLRDAETHLAANKIKMPRNDALVLLSAATGRRIEALLTHPESRIPDRQLTLYREWVQKRAAQYPLQYLTRRQEFYGRPFFVSPAVLIPRPETEIVVQACLDFLTGLHRPARALDIGTGSGCIALTLLCEVPDLKACAVDISPEALKVARTNSRKLECEGRLTLFEGSIVNPLLSGSHRFDLVVSNPPYVALSDPVDPEVEHEPAQAVYAGPSGSEIYEEIFAKTAELLNPGGRLVLEAGFGQAEVIAGLGNSQGWEEVERRTDLAGIDRSLMFQATGVASPTG